MSPLLVCDTDSLLWHSNEVVSRGCNVRRTSHARKPARRLVISPPSARLSGSRREMRSCCGSRTTNYRLRRSSAASTEHSAVRALFKRQWVVSGRVAGRVPRSSEARVGSYSMHQPYSPSSTGSRATRNSTSTCWEGAVASAVNVSEVHAKLVSRGWS
jgi:hypothetical protein